jgi:hypothetical protein
MIWISASAAVKRGAAATEELIMADRPSSAEDAAVSTLDALFEDLTIELNGLEKAPAPKAAPSLRLVRSTEPPPEKRELPPPEKRQPSFIEQALAAIDQGGLSPAAPLLSDGDPSDRSTRPYEIPPEELARAGRDEDGWSQIITLPVEIEELPGEAYSTKVRPAFLWEQRGADPFEALNQKLEAERRARAQKTADADETVRRNVIVPDDAKR